MYSLISRQIYSCKCPFSAIPGKLPYIALPHNSPQSNKKPLFPLPHLCEYQQSMCPCCKSRTQLLPQSKNDHSFHISLSLSPIIHNSKMQLVQSQKCVLRFCKSLLKNEGCCSVLSIYPGLSIDGRHYSKVFLLN